jgi:hypothetical protein
MVFTEQLVQQIPRENQMLQHYYNQNVLLLEFCLASAGSNLTWSCMHIHHCSWHGTKWGRGVGLLSAILLASEFILIKPYRKPWMLQWKLNRANCKSATTQVTLTCTWKGLLMAQQSRQTTVPPSFLGIFPWKKHPFPFTRHKYWCSSSLLSSHLPSTPKRIKSTPNVQKISVVLGFVKVLLHLLCTISFPVLFSTFCTTIWVQYWYHYCFSFLSKYRRISNRDRPDLV